MPTLEDPTEYLKVFDSRTQRDYKIHISNNAVRATDFSSIKLPSGSLAQNGQGLRVFDRGFMNTACVESSITLM